MFIEGMNTLSAILVPQLNGLIVTAWHNQPIVWRESAKKTQQKNQHLFSFILTRQRLSKNVQYLWKDSYLAHRTQLMCWLRENRNFCLWTVHNLTVLSSEAVTIVCPSPEKLTLRTVAVWALKTVESAFLYVHGRTKKKKNTTAEFETAASVFCRNPFLDVGTVNA